MFKRPNSSNILCLFLFCQWIGTVEAFQIIPLYASQQYTALDGCCQSTDARAGGAGILRTEFGNFGTFDVFGFSDRKWNEVSLLKPVYLIGHPVSFDPTLDGVTSVRRVPHVIVLWSYGGGFFSHSTRTKQFDLATLVSGITLVNHFEIQYSLTDRFSLVAMARLGAAVSMDDRGFVMAPFLGILWRL
jgi:hypothetical protein